jgi:multidrug efflux pump subunit AcrB
MTDDSLSISGRIARAFVRSEITPLLALAGLLLGLFAVLVTPREEEPQINVTFANIFIPFPGASPSEVEQLITTRAEQAMSEIEGIEHVYSVSRAGMSVLTVQFKVGERRTDAIVRLYDKVYSNQDWLPPSLGAGQPLVKPRGIDDVPIVTATLWTADPERSAYDLLQVAHAAEVELKRVDGTGEVATIGGPDRVVHVLIDPQKLGGYGIALDDLRNALRAANASADAGAVIADDREITVKAGTFLSDATEVAELVVGLHGGKPVFLSDVAEVREGPDTPANYVSFATGPAAATAEKGKFPAVTIAIAKKPGTNAVQIADRLIERIEALEGLVIPEGVNVTITRNYGETANAKAMKLIQKLLFATASVVALVLLTMGWRPAVIVGAAVIVTLAITLFASWAYGFTINRVSLFALIFSIGILVDDAIVVVENIHRHMARHPGPVWELIPVAVDEVGGPTILATFTVIAALLPMAFVSGLMGPYMSPIPINASMGMLISLAVAFVITPWLAFRLMAPHAAHADEPDSAGGDRLSRLFDRIIGTFIAGKRARARRYGLVAALFALMLAAVALAVVQLVVMKMLPFDNKSEIQIVVDMPEGTSLERTAAVMDEIAGTLAAVPEVVNYQTYVGTASPIGFNGLVRQYYLRQEPYLGDIQINLVDAHDRDRMSHDIARSVREALASTEAARTARIKVVEVPPGPPVLAPLVAEIYGPDYAGQIEVAKAVRAVFEAVPGIVDVDDTTEEPALRLVMAVDRQRASRLGISQSAVSSALATVLGGEDASFIHGAHLKYSVPIRIEYPERDKGDARAILALKVRGTDGRLVPLSEIVTVREATREHSIHHKDLLPVVYVTGDMAGVLDSPLYGMGEIYSRLGEGPLTHGKPIDQYFVDQPANPYRYALRWDGEWRITYETFRDMGIAYAAGLVLIYFLVVAQFRSYLVPVIIMVPIPLTIIGVLPGHALLGAQFTATSMIGMIALAGIIVRNSILLVDFINHQTERGMALERAVIASAAVRAKPIVLTGLAAMLGAFFILDDPIFSGLAVSLIFGILVSTALTLVVIPVVYFSYERRRRARVEAASATA